MVLQGPHVWANAPLPSKENDFRSTCSVQTVYVHFLSWVSSEHPIVEKDYSFLSKAEIKIQRGQAQWLTKDILLSGITTIETSYFCSFHMLLFDMLTKLDTIKCMKVLLGKLLLGELSELTMWLGALLTWVPGLNRGTYERISCLSGIGQMFSANEVIDTADSQGLRWSPSSHNEEDSEDWTYSSGKTIRRPRYTQGGNSHRRALTWIRYTNLNGWNEHAA